MLRVSGGAITRLAPLDIASADGITVEGRRTIRFRFDDPANASGFDLRVDPEACVELDVTSRDESVPAMTFLGADAKTPPALPARFCPG